VRLKKLVAELSLANHVLQEVAPHGHATSEQWLEAVERARTLFGGGAAATVAADQEDKKHPGFSAPQRQIALPFL